MSANEIFTGLWLGNVKDSKNPDFINRMDIIINCSKSLPFLDNTKKCLRVYVDDNLDKEEIYNLYNYLPKMTEVIHTSLQHNKNVFVHCFAGKQRSASIVVGYLIRYCGLTLEQAKIVLETKRNIVFTPYMNFESALKLFEENYYKKFR